MRFALPEWITKPDFYVPVLISLLLFVFSLYGAEIRRIIDTRPTSTRNWWRSARLNYFRFELDNLNRRHNNAYELILYALTEVGFMILLGFGSGVVLLIMFFTQSLSHLLALIGFYVLGCFVTLIANVYRELRHLNHYDERVAYLEKKIAEYT